MKIFHSFFRLSNVSVYIYIATVPSAPHARCPAASHRTSSARQSPFFLVLKLFPPMSNKSAHSFDSSHTPSLLEVVNGCLSWRNFQLLHSKYYLLQKENNDNSDSNTKRVYLAPAAGSQHFKSSLCGHISSVVTEEPGKQCCCCCCCCC